jgi:hypothetical protein
MYQIITDETKGTIQITDTYETGATGPDAPPTFEGVGDEFGFSYVDLQSVEKFKSFTYSSVGEIEGRYLYPEYRISRNKKSWTPWIPLKENIDNFPPFTHTDPMYLDVKFTRQGEILTGVITLLEYSFIGSIGRDVVDGESTIVLSPSNASVIVKPPYVYKVFKLTDIEVISRGDTQNYTIKYRYSQDYGRTVTDWEPFTKANMTTAKITPIRFFQIEYLIEYSGTTQAKIYDINLIGDFQNVTLDYKKTNLYGVRENCNCLKLGLVSDPKTDMTVPQGGESNMIMPTPASGNLPQLTDAEKNNLYKPYQLQVASDLLNKMSTDSNEIFGHQVVYFLTDPDRKGIDYSFHEYQLYNYICDELIKVSVENNQFPENTGMINQFDLSLFDSFEIHIPKETFKKAFGPEKRPSKEDFLWFCEINRMFTIEHAQPYRGFNNYVIYYKVMLKKYTQKANVIAGNQTIQDRVRELTKNSTIDELFGNENRDDKLAVANKEQFRPLTRDILRVEIAAIIGKELIENADNVIAKTHYDLSSVAFGSEAVTYRNMKNQFRKSDNFSYMCWFNMFNYVTNDQYGFFDYYDSTNSNGIRIGLSNDNVRVILNQAQYNMPLGSGGGVNSLDEETWYAYLVNVDQRKGKISQYLYKRDVDMEEEAVDLVSTKLRLLYSIESNLVSEDMIIEDGVSAVLKGADMKLTNIRFFEDIVPVSEHNKILNQTFVRDDSKYLIFADNANSKLSLPYYPLGNLNTPEVG